MANAKEYTIGRIAFENICAVEGIKPPLNWNEKKMTLVHDVEKAANQHLGPDARQKLKNFIDRVEKLEEDRAALGADIRDIFAVAKSDGFDVKAMKQIIRLRRKAKAERDDELNAIDVYLHALEML